MSVRAPLTGLAAHGYLDPLKGWGGFGFYFIENRAAAYTKHPSDAAWLFDPDTMKPRVNNPGWVQAIQDVLDLINTDGAYPADQINADPALAALFHAAVPDFLPPGLRNMHREQSNRDERR